MEERVARDASPSAVELTRRKLLGRAVLGGSALALGGSVLSPPRTTAAADGAVTGRLATAAPRVVPVGLPTAADLRSDFETMVGFGARFTGSDAHNNYIGWLEHGLIDAGVQLMPCDSYLVDRWLAEHYALDVLDGTAAGPVKVATYLPRSQFTPARGVSGPLAYGGTAPVLSLNGADSAATMAALAAYPAQFTSWANAQSSTVGSLQGKIALVDVPMPTDTTTAILATGASYLQWDGHTEADWLSADYKRLWLAPGVSGIPTAPFASQGAIGVVFILDSSYAALAGAYIPFENGFEPIPALFVDRDTGTRLRAATQASPTARLTLTGTRKTVRTSSIVGVLPGRSQETIILNTHSDGEGFVEENCGPVLVRLARYFGSLPQAQRLERTLVFSIFSGHMAPGMPQCQGFIDDHPDLIARAAGAVTLEHFGCTEWNDTTDKGYHPTGDPEAFAIWASQGEMTTLVQNTVVAHGLPRTAVLKPPAQFGVGSAFESAKVPQLGAIAGPNYLLTDSATTDAAKIDYDLAARQTAWAADFIKQLDPVPAAQLRQGDPVLGSPTAGSTGSAALGGYERVACVTSAGVGGSPGAGGGTGLGPAVTVKVGRLIVRWYGRRHPLHGVLVELNTSTGVVRNIEVQLLRHGRLVTQAHVGLVRTARRRVVLRRAHDARFAAGSYTLVIRRRGRVLAQRVVQVG